MKGMIIFTAVVTSIFATIAASYIWVMNKRAEAKRRSGQCD